MAMGQPIVLQEEGLGSVFFSTCLFFIGITIILLFQVLFALSGLNGAILWEFGDHVVKSDLMSLYAPQVNIILTL